MAYEYDQLGNVIGEYETDEERLARLKAEQEAAQAQVHKQEVITRADGTQTVKTQTEVPAKPAVPVSTAPASPVAPPQPRGPSRAEQAQQAVSGGRPVAPTQDALFNNMLGAESNNQQFDRNGQILTSPKGALGAAQIMPATAANPGFGIKPATPEEIATPEGNRAFGLRYKQGMDSLFGGDPAKTAAAYNAGPGRVQQAEQMAAQRGGSWTDYIPKETRDYIQKTAGNVLNAVIPSAQAGTLTPAQRNAPPTITPGAPTSGMPQSPAIPGQQNVQIDDNGNKLITNPDGTTTVLGPDNRPMLAGGQEPTNTPQYQARLFTDVQNDPMKLMQLYSDKSIPEPLRNLAGQQVSDLMRQSTQKKEAENTTKTLLTNWSNGDPKAGRQLADEMKKDEGSWIKMLLLGFISPELAGTEAIKLGFGAQWQTQRLDDGTEALVKVRKDGKPMMGYDAKTGAELSPNQLAGVAGGKKELDIVGGSYVSDTLKDKNGNALVGRLVSDKKTGQSYIQTDEGLKPMAGFRPQSSTGSLNDMRVKQIQQLNIELQGKTLEEKMKILRDRNTALVGAGLQPIDPNEVNLSAPQIGGGQVQTGGGTTTTTGGGTTTAGTTGAPAGSNLTTAPTATELEGRKKVVEEANKVIAGSSGFMDKIDVVNEGITATTKKNNLGTIAEGVLPGERFLGKHVMGSADQRNTDKALNAVKVLAAEGMKTLGANPTDADRDYLTANIPDETWGDKDVREWLTTRRDFIKRKVEVAKKQVSSGGSYVPEMPADVPTKSENTGGIKIIKREKMQ